MKRYWLPVLFLLLLLATPALIHAGGYFTFTSADSVEAPEVSVEIDGQKVEVVDFFHVDAGDNSAFLSHPAGRRQFVFLFDLIFSSKDDVLAARKTVLEFLQKSSKEDLFAVAGIATTGMKIYCAPTVDRNEVIAGLNAIGRDRVEGMTAGPDGNYVPAVFTADPVALQPLDDEVFQKNLGSFGLGEKRKEDHVFIMVQGLVDFAHSLCALQGRKNVIFFSPGFETKGISLNLDLEQRRNDTRNTSTASNSEPASLDTVTNSFRNFEELAKKGPPVRPRQHGVEIIPELYEGADAHVQVVDFSGGNGFLKSLAEKTGAFYFQKACNVDQVLAAEQKFYVVQWQDTKRKDWKALTSLKISAGARKISAQEKWLVTRPPAEQTPEEKRMHLAESVYKDFRPAPPEYRFWVDFAYEEGKSKIPSFIQIPGNDLLKNGQESLKLEFYCYILRGDGTVLDAGSAPVELDLSNGNLRERISASGLKVWSLMLADEQPLTVRFIIINSGTGETITSSQYVGVKGAGLTMSNPFVPATDFNWIVWPKPQEEVTRRGVQIRYPYRVGSDLFFPDLAPVMKSGPNAGVIYFRLYNILPESKNPAVKFHLLDAKGQSVEIQDFHLMQKPKDLEHSGMELFWDLTSLPAVQPGPYRIKIGVMDPLRKQVVVREVQNLKIPSS